MKQCATVWARKSRPRPSPATFCPHRVVKNMLQFLSWRLARSEQIDIRGRDLFPEPEQHERSAFQDELVGVHGSRQAIEQAFAGESNKRELVVHAERVAVLRKPSLNGREDVFRRRLHRTIVSMYGCMTRLTRSCFATRCSSSRLSRRLPQASLRASSTTSRPIVFLNLKQSTTVRARL